MHSYFRCYTSAGCACLRSTAGYWRYEANYRLACSITKTVISVRVISIPYLATSLSYINSQLL